jgi:hypothetical protein
VALSIPSCQKSRFSGVESGTNLTVMVSISAVA